MARMRMAPGAEELAVIQNFQRIENFSEATPDVAGGNQSITGSVVIETGLSRVDCVVASLGGVPAAATAYVRAFPDANNKSQITVTVYTNAFAVSGVPINVQWIAMGERILG